MAGLLLVLLGCVIPTGGPAPPPPAPVEAGAGELCPEHGVLQTVCPKCNPKLVAVFQAQGDWCPEHGLPESFCPICAPERGGRPAPGRLDPPDGAPPDGTRLRFRTRETARLIGLQTAPVAERRWQGGVSAPVRLIWDPQRVAQVSARAPGVVSALYVAPGSQVQAGDPLVLLQSGALGGERSRLAAAEQAVEGARAQLARREQLLAGGLGAAREVQEARQALAEAEATRSGLRSNLAFLGEARGDGTVLRSPLRGIVTRVFSGLGASVEPQLPLVEVVDPDQVWAELDLREADLAEVAPGQTVRITWDAWPDQEVEGELARLAPEIDETTRTTHGWVALANPGGHLRKNLTGTAEVLTRQARPVFAAPAEALQTVSGVHYVFVQEAPDSWLARRVQLLARQGDEVRLLGPLSAEDQVVTTGSFLLKTELMKDSIGAGCCEGD